MIKSLRFLSFLFVFNVNLYSGITIYVKYNATGSNNGTSWTNAYTSFQSALDVALSGDQIWVAAGTYYPTTQINGTGARYAAFQMTDGVGLYGGFAGTEDQLSLRDISVNITILSGDIGTIGINTDNCYHVFFNGRILLTSTAILDGFTITKGYADYPDWAIEAYAGGMINLDNNSPTILNCTFSNNYARFYGGAMSIHSSSPTIVNCLFTGNSLLAGGRGGAILNYESNTNIINCTFTNNSSSDGIGGGICTFVSGTTTVKNSIIWGNTANDVGKQIYGSTLIYNSCYANGTGDVVGITPSNCITTDPQFVGSGSYPYAILGISPCTDAGDDSYISEIYDIRGSSYPRKLNKSTGAAGTVDIGAYEYKAGNDPVPVELSSFSAVWESDEVVLNWTTATERNNYGFEIERAEVDKNRYGNLPFGKIGFIQGHVLSNSPKEYSFVDNTVSPGNKYSYRLKQIDNDGPTSYSKIIEVQTGVIPGGFILNQNFPNPFNPSTTIKFAFADKTKAELNLYDVLGNKVAELFNNNADAGRFYEVQFNASNLSSGVYYYKLTGANKAGIKKMLLLK